jgi:hypothetical protein
MCRSQSGVAWAGADPDVQCDARCMMPQQRVRWGSLLLQAPRQAAPNVLHEHKARCTQSSVRPRGRDPSTQWPWHHCDHWEPRDPLHTVCLAMSFPQLSLRGRAWLHATLSELPNCGTDLSIASAHLARGCVQVAHVWVPDAAVPALLGPALLQARPVFRQPICHWSPGKAPRAEHPSQGFCVKRSSGARCLIRARCPRASCLARACASAARFKGLMHKCLVV